jgi:putative ABC transport system substrate-binding protein
MVGVRDPVGAGLITNLARPGGNMTGVALSPSRELTGKQLQLLKDLMPSLGRVALIWNSVNAAHLSMLDEIEAQACAP